MPARSAAAGGLLVLLAGCSAGGVPASAPSDPPLGTGTVQVGAVRLHVAVARTEAQREAGLRGRDVPAGTGMAFPYPGGAQVRFTMAGVGEPLVVVFARGGRAVSVEFMAPCAGTVAQCPLYGPRERFDLVVEAAPDSLPAARVGDGVVLTTS